MTCRKGEFYIAMEGYTAKKVSGYIINEKIGFTRDTYGDFYPTELTTGMDAVNRGWKNIMSSKYNGVYNLSNAYKASMDCHLFDRLDESLLKPSKKMRMCMTIIKKAYKSDEEKKWS